MVAGGQVGEEPGEETVAAFSAANSENVWGRSFTRVCAVGDNGPPPKREGGGYWGIGLVEIF